MYNNRVDISNDVRLILDLKNDKITDEEFLSQVNEVFKCAYIQGYLHGTGRKNVGNKPFMKKYIDEHLTDKF